MSPVEGGPQCCPKHDELEAFSLGRLPVEQVEAIDAHLSSCETCLARLEPLSSASDPLVSAVRTRYVDSPDTRLAGFHSGLLACERLLDRGVVGAATGAMPEPRSGISLPHRIGQYQLTEELGRGGMGCVYRAIHTSLQKQVAVKLLSPARLQKPLAVERFQREMRTAGQLKHRHVVEAIDAGSEHGQPFLVLEYIHGWDLERLVRRFGPLSLPAAAEAIRQAALGLQHAYERGIVHRDLKPSNLLLDGEGTVKLSDFGIALLKSLSGQQGMTGADQFMGTVDYVAPEQIEDTHDVDIRADIYSLGCTLFYLLSGRPPFRSGLKSGMYQRLQAHVVEPVPSLRSLLPDIPAALDQAFLRMMAKRREERFATPLEVAEALRPFADAQELLRLARCVSFASPPLQSELRETQPLRDQSTSKQLAQPGAIRKAPPARRFMTTGWSLALAGLLTVLAAGMVIYLRSDRGKVVLPNEQGDAATRGYVPQEAAELAAGNSSRVHFHTVTTLLDEEDADAGAGNSLREAILATRATPGPDSIQFAAGLHGGTITLRGTPLPELNADVTIAGPGADLIAISGDGASRVFDVAEGSSVALLGVTILNGHAVGDAAEVAAQGGALLNRGRLYVGDCAFRDNRADGHGGAIRNSGNLQIDRTTFSGNHALQHGGAIWNLTGDVTISASLFTGNTAALNGGALYNHDGTLKVVNSTLSANSAHGSGGGILNGVNGSLQVTSSTLTGNRSDRDGVGLGGGGGIATRGPDALLHNTICAANFDGAGTEANDVQGVLWATSGFNLIGDAATAGGLVHGAEGNQVGVDPLLGPLADNGGPTWTHALSSRSPALDAGSNDLAVGGDGARLTRDQRGSARFVDRTSRGAALADIGAYEAALLQTDSAAPAPTSWSLIIDNGEPGYRETGPGWRDGNVNLSAAYRRNYRYAEDKADTASWTFGNLPPGRYHVFVTWNTHPNRVKAARYEVRDSEQLLQRVNRDQILEPDDDFAEGQGWNRLGTFSIASGILTVTLDPRNSRSERGGGVIADAVRIVREFPEP